MTIYTAVRRLERPDGKRFVDIEVNDIGSFRFIEMSEFEGTDYLDRPASYWAPTYISGLYDSAEAAERESKVTLPWLRDSISN